MVKIKLIIPFSLLICFIILLYIYWGNFNNNLGRGYFYSDDKSIHCERSEGGQIPPTVISFDYNRNFIIGQQQPKWPRNIMYKDYIYEKGDSVVYYWLIIKKEDKVLGPCDKKQFDNLKIKYGVPKSLILK